MDDLAIVVKWSDRFSLLLKEYYHAEGENLHELIASCEERLPLSIHEKLKYIAAVNADALQVQGYKLADARQFLEACKICEKNLQPRSARTIWRFVLFLIFAVTAGAIWFYVENWNNLTGS